MKKGSSQGVQHEVHEPANERSSKQEETCGAAPLNGTIEQWSPQDGYLYAGTVKGLAKSPKYAEDLYDFVQKHVVGENEGLVDFSYEQDSKHILHMHFLLSSDKINRKPTPVRYWYQYLAPVDHYEKYINYMKKHCRTQDQQDMILLRHYSHWNNMFEPYSPQSCETDIPIRSGVDINPDLTELVTVSKTGLGDDIEDRGACSETLSQEEIHAIYKEHERKLRKWIPKDQYHAALKESEKMRREYHRNEERNWYPKY